jgi:hypothetical protein
MSFSFSELVNSVLANTTYLKLSGKKLGLLLNFNVDVMKNGVRRKINGQL